MITDADVDRVVTLANKPYPSSIDLLELAKLVPEISAEVRRLRGTPAVLSVKAAEELVSEIERLKTEREDFRKPCLCCRERVCSDGCRCDTLEREANPYASHDPH